MSNPSVQRSRYWVFDEQQLDEALAAYVERDGMCSDEEISGIVDFLDSPELKERGMRRGGED